MQGSWGRSARVRPPHTDEDDAHAGQKRIASLRTPRRTPHAQHDPMTQDARRMQVAMRGNATGGNILACKCVG